MRLPPSLPPYPANESTESLVRERVLRTVPERYLFRIGMVPSCCLIIYVWYLVLEWVRGEEKIMAPVKGSTAAESHYTKEGVAAALGTIGAMLLIIASSVIEEGQMPWCVESRLPSFLVRWLILELYTGTSTSSVLRASSSSPASRS